MKSLILFLVLFSSLPVLATVVVNTKPSATFVSQKCDRVKGQAGPAETRFIRIEIGLNGKGCKVIQERRANPIPPAYKPYFGEPLYKSDNTDCKERANVEVKKLLKHGFTCVNE